MTLYFTRVLYYIMSTMTSHRTTMHLRSAPSTWTPPKFKSQADYVLWCICNIRVRPGWTKVCIEAFPRQRRPWIYRKRSWFEPISLRIKCLWEASRFWCLRGRFSAKILRLHRSNGSRSISSCLSTFRPRQAKAESNIARISPNAESLNCVKYSDALYPQAIEVMQEIHRAGVHHRDIYPKNLLLVRGNPDRLVWIDFDVATTFTDFGSEQLARCDHEISLV